MKTTSEKINKNSFYKNTIFVGIIALSIFNLSGAHAQGMMNREYRDEMMRQGIRPNTLQNNIIGTVTAINGNTLTVSEIMRGQGRNAPTSTVTYTVDGSNAKVLKSGATSSLSTIVTGDKVSVNGTMSGTNISAKIIHVGFPGMIRLKDEFIGNGQPVVEGKITSLSGNTLYITNNSNVSYTIDVSNAKIFVNGATSSISNLQTNSEVVVQGTVNGNSVVASSVISHNAPNNNTNNPIKTNRGFFGRMKNFFGHFFGF